MIAFKSTQDLQKLTTDNPAHSVIKKLIDQLIRAYTWEGHPYIAEDYGYIILIEPEDTDRVLEEIWDDWRLLDIPWEGITLRDGFYTAIFLANNEYGLVFVIPNEDRIQGGLMGHALHGLQNYSFSDFQGFTWHHHLGALIDPDTLGTRYRTIPNCHSKVRLICKSALIFDADQGAGRFFSETEVIDDCHDFDTGIDVRLRIVSEVKHRVSSLCR